MSKTLRIGLLALAVLGISFLACEKLGGPVTPETPVGTRVAYDWSGDIEAGSTHKDVGDYFVTFSSDNIYILLKTDSTKDWFMKAWYVQIEDTCDWANAKNRLGELILKNGKPVAGKFDYKSGDFAYDPSVLITIPWLSEWDDEDELCFILHVNVDSVVNNVVYQRQTCYGDSTTYPGQWWQYFCIEIPEFKSIVLPTYQIHVMGKDPIFEKPKCSFYSRMMLDDVGTGYNIWDGEWTAFCLQQNLGMPGGVWHDAWVYNSCDLDTATLRDEIVYGQKYVGGSGWVVDYTIPTHYDWINYLLNYVIAHEGNDPPFDADHTLMIQHIVWYWRGTYQIYGYSLTADELAWKTQAETYGNGFQPALGEWFAVLLDCGNTIQLSFIVADP